MVGSDVPALAQQFLRRDSELLEALLEVEEVSVDVAQEGDVRSRHFRVVDDVGLSSRLHFYRRTALGLLDAEPGLEVRVVLSQHSGNV